MQSKKSKTFLAVCMFLSCATFLTGCDSNPETGNSGDDTEEIDTWYTVSLNPNGGTFSDGTTDTKVIQVGENHAIDFSSYEVTYEGNVLYGWYYENGSPWPGARKVTEDVSLIAKWNVAEEEVEVDLDIWNDDDTHLTVKEEAGIYQFSKTSPVYGGYVYRTATYSIAHDDLVYAIENVETDGKAQCVIHAESSYSDATGSCYAEFFNDGVVELVYDFAYGGSQRKYCMESYYYSIEGVTFPYETPDSLADSGTSTHYADNDEALAGGPGCNTDDSDDTGDEADADNLAKDYVKGKVIYTASSTNSQTMTAAFTDNGLIYLQYSGYNTGTIYSYSYSADTDLVITNTSDSSSIAVSEAESGTYTFSDGTNTYSVTETELAAAIPTSSVITTITASNTTTMQLAFNSNHTWDIQYDLSSMGYTGWYTTQSGTWNYDSTDGFQLGGSGITLSIDSDEVYTLSDGTNTYKFEAGDIVSEAKNLATDYVQGTTIYTANATNSDTMHAVFTDNGLIYLQYYTYNTGTVYEYSYSSESDLTITDSAGSSVAVSEAESGTYTFSDGTNTYSVTETELAAAIPTSSVITTITASNTTTMQLAFNSNHTWDVQYDLSSASYGTGWYTTQSGTWNYDETNGVQIGGSGISVYADSEGNYTFSDGTNTYVFTASQISSAAGTAA